MSRHDGCDQSRHICRCIVVHVQFAEKDNATRALPSSFETLILRITLTSFNACIRLIRLFIYSKSSLVAFQLNCASILATKSCSFWCLMLHPPHPNRFCYINKSFWSLQIFDIEFRFNKWWAWLFTGRCENEFLRDVFDGYLHSPRAFSLMSAVNGKLPVDNQ